MIFDSKRPPKQDDALSPFSSKPQLMQKQTRSNSFAEQTKTGLLNKAAGWISTGRSAWAALLLPRCSPGGVRGKRHGLESRHPPHAPHHWSRHVFSSHHWRSLPATSPTKIDVLRDNSLAAFSQWGHVFCCRYRHRSLRMPRVTENIKRPGYTQIAQFHPRPCRSHSKVNIRKDHCKKGSLQGLLLAVRHKTRGNL